jgi:hypothetical protein
VAAELGHAIAHERWGLVFGGGATGLMGEVAHAALVSGAHVTGVIPHRLARPGVAFRDATELICTDTMRERKRIMDERSDAFVVLPGGIGTLEELVEIITLKQLGYHDRAIVMLDGSGHWEPLRGLLRRMIAEGLAHPSLTDLWQVTASVKDTIQALRAYRPPESPPHGPVPLDALKLETIEPPPDE